MDHINSKLRKFKIDSSQSMDYVENIIHESPFVLAKRSANESLNKTLNYRAGVLRTVTTFSTIHYCMLMLSHCMKNFMLGIPPLMAGNMSKDSLYAAALSMEDAYFTRGQHIIIQDQVGDTFYLIEEGQVLVTVSSSSLCCIAMTS